MKPTTDTPATPNTPATPAPTPKTVTEQKADFTAEGSPPPGKVATNPPETTAEPKATLNKSPA
jgi:hypothetical protein